MILWKHCKDWFVTDLENLLWKFLKIYWFSKKPAKNMTKQLKINIYFYIFWTIGSQGRQWRVDIPRNVKKWKSLHHTAHSLVRNQPHNTPVRHQLHNSWKESAAQFSSEDLAVKLTGKESAAQCPVRNQQHSYLVRNQPHNPIMRNQMHNSTVKNQPHK